MAGLAELERSLLSILSQLRAYLPDVVVTPIDRVDEPAL